uniref:Uncharacterized protein n=1 Tax=Zooxanthella nutricula TaxID=1333877 RepID=A0A6U8TU38_9DINO|mmetsp:Transcript_15737/g.46684  ORF Transcript_15737/g.46684 Transcript_15737/m.46684 type:complete len:255 (+) Transcript_15737:98-862(+)|eukprot:CAMPEP_0198504356 /NCGR_PEP_ID=MMETSP1462-20131121/10457_1 /TAXON_ID=1333877 /ORGANISM="Brandtodinium nutriculum, Strain RCC3387" /LENGTH=254 /DNA_ID=CAMNT_0044233521 /DNA_START=98 /DNA_END=862 /DNA_ORIENTATION=+
MAPADIPNEVSCFGVLSLLGQFVEHVLTARDEPKKLEPHKPEAPRSKAPKLEAQQSETQEFIGKTRSIARGPTIEVDSRSSRGATWPRAPGFTRKIADATKGIRQKIREEREAMRLGPHKVEAKPSGAKLTRTLLKAQEEAMALRRMPSEEAGGAVGKRATLPSEVVGKRSTLASTEVVGRSATMLEQPMVTRVSTMNSQDMPTLMRSSSLQTTASKSSKRVQMVGAMKSGPKMVGSGISSFRDKIDRALAPSA